MKKKIISAIIVGLVLIVGITTITSCAPFSSIVPPVSANSSATIVPICTLSSVPIADIFMWLNLSFPNLRFP